MPARRLAFLLAVAALAASLPVTLAVAPGRGVAYYEVARGSASWGDTALARGRDLT